MIEARGEKGGFDSEKERLVFLSQLSEVPPFVRGVFGPHVPQDREVAVGSDLSQSLKNHPKLWGKRRAAK